MVLDAALSFCRAVYYDLTVFSVTSTTSIFSKCLFRPSNAEPKKPKTNCAADFSARERGEWGTNGRLVRWRTTCLIEWLRRSGRHKARSADRANGEAFNPPRARSPAMGLVAELNRQFASRGGSIRMIPDDIAVSQSKTH